MEILTKYITADEFLQYFGIDLGAKLKGNSNPSDKANAFLKRIEDDVEQWLNYTYQENINYLYPEFNDYQKEQYKLALLNQAMYVFRNGDTGMDSGYDPDNGFKASSSQLMNVMICQKSKMCLVNAGLCDRHIGQGRVGGMFPWGM